MGQAADIVCKITPVKTKKLVKLLLSLGWTIRKRHSGSSHMVFEKTGELRPQVLSDYHETPEYQVLQIIKRTGLSRKDFIDKINSL